MPIPKEVKESLRSLGDKKVSQALAKAESANTLPIGISVKQTHNAVLSGLKHSFKLSQSLRNELKDGYWPSCLPEVKVLSVEYAVHNRLLRKYNT